MASSAHDDLLPQDVADDGAGGAPLAMIMLAQVASDQAPGVAGGEAETVGGSQGAGADVPDDVEDRIRAAVPELRDTRGKLVVATLRQYLVHYGGAQFLHAKHRLKGPNSHLLIKRGELLKGWHKFLLADAASGGFDKDRALPVDALEPVSRGATSRARRAQVEQISDEGNDKEEHMDTLRYDVTGLELGRWAKWCAPGIIQRAQASAVAKRRRERSAESVHLDDGGSEQAALALVQQELLDAAVCIIDKDTLFHCMPSQILTCLQAALPHGDFSRGMCAGAGLAPSPFAAHEVSLLWL